MMSTLALTLASAAVGVVAGFWFCLGSVFTSSRQIAELVGRFWGDHPSKVEAYVKQTCQYSVGAPLLVIAFLLQVWAAIAPSRQVAPLPPGLDSWVGLLASVAAVSGIASYLAYRVLVKVKTRRVRDMLNMQGGAQ